MIERLESELRMEQRLTNRLWKFSRMVLMLSSVLVSCGSAFAGSQILRTISPVLIYQDSGALELVVGYETSPLGAQTTGVGITVFFDRTKLSFVSLEALVEDGIVGLDNSSASVRADRDDGDDDALTDAKVGIAYVSITGQWPNEALPHTVELFKATFELADRDFIGETGVNFVITAGATGYESVNASVNVNIDPR